jgi:hypothetical protein
MSTTTTVDAAGPTGAVTARDALRATPLNRDGTPAARLGRIVRPLSRSLRAVFGLGLAAMVSGCLQRSLPLPPPSISAQVVTECSPNECPQGGLIVVLEGLALPGARVAVDDTAMHANPLSGERLSVLTDADAAGAWRAVVGPVRVRGTMTVLAPRVGDALSVFQISTPANEVSSPVTVVVVAPR